LGDGAAHSDIAIGPGHGATLGVPLRTIDDIVAVVEPRDTGTKDNPHQEATHKIAWIAADEAVGLGDWAACSRAAGAPRHRPTIAVPAGRVDDIVAGGSEGIDITHQIAGLAALRPAIPGRAAD